MLQFVHAAFRPIATMLAASDGRATSKFANMIANAPLAESGAAITGAVCPDHDASNPKTLFSILKRYLLVRINPRP
jgi:hypothetical protein